MKDKFKPMLAAGYDGTMDELIEKFTYPVMASPKLDGIRCVIRNGQVLSRSLKPIPNKHIQATLQKNISLIEGFDGELMVGRTFQDCSSGVMTQDGTPRFTYMVFDYTNTPSLPYVDRVERYSFTCRGLRSAIVRPIPVLLCGNADHLRMAVQQFLEEGYEGAIVRKPTGVYKFGRATFKEGSMTKLKPMVDDEATIVGFEEQQKNNNEKTVNELGQNKRSSHKSNKVGKLTLGALQLHHPKFGDFNCGTGMDDALRKEIWDNMPKYLGKKVTFRYQAIGTKDKPRIPSFKGFRSDLDL